jgi:AraC family transcriptional regulator, transcriptional activator of pobA
MKRKQETVPVHNLADLDADDGSCRILKLNKPSPKAVIEAHRHNYFEILLFKAGGGNHMIDFNTHEITACSLHFVSPGQIHALNRTQETEGSVVIFSRDFMLLNAADTALLKEFPAFNKTSAPVLRLQKNEFNEIAGLIDHMELEFRMEKAYANRVIAAYIGIVLLKCKAQLIETEDYKRTDPGSQELMQRFNNLLEENFIVLHKVNEYAELLHVTPNHLSETIKKLTGKTAGELIHDRLILEAKRLLLHSTLTAKEVAYALHFNDPSYFSRFFKANTTLSPEGFRKEIREKYQH